MHHLSFQPISVLIDGGSREGRLVMADGALVAVFIRVTGDDTASGRQHSASGWFLEAGFGPCSGLLTTPPPVFPTLEEAQTWIRGLLDAKLSARSG